MTSASTPLPEQLFHYTSPAGAMGILQTGSVWATMVHYMNDAQEFQYALDLSREILHIEVRSDGAGTEHQAICEEYLRTIQQLTIYAFSLSEERDLLSQWRAYCPPEGGYAVGFSSAELRDVAESQGFSLVACVYRRDAQVALLRPVIRQMLDTARQLHRGVSGNELHPTFTSRFAEVGAALKHPSFEEEREWRLVSVPSSNESVRHRVQRGLIVPYYDLVVARESCLPISCVIVGPHRHPELAARSLRNLTATGPTGWPVRVEHSSSPFRILG